MSWYQNVSGRSITKSLMTGPVTIIPGEIFDGRIHPVKEEPGRIIKINPKAALKRASTITVVRLTMLGDVLIALAALRALVANAIGATGLLVTSSRYADFLLDCHVDLDSPIAVTASRITSAKVADDAIFLNWEGVFETDLTVNRHLSRFDIATRDFIS